MVEDAAIGLTIRTLRKELRLSTTAFAKRASISQAQISRLERGLQGFRLATLRRIAEALGVPVFRFLMTDDEWATWTRLAD